jgi:hypothetical protein
LDVDAGGGRELGAGGVVGFGDAGGFFGADHVFKSLLVFSLKFSGKQKGRAGEARPGKGKRFAVSTSYGGMTRVRFGGFFPRVGKSRLPGLEAPLSLGGRWKRLGERARRKWGWVEAEMLKS